MSHNRLIEVIGSVGSEAALAADYLLNFRLFPFRSPLLRESLLLFFPLATKMFQFTRLSLPFL